MTYETEKKRSGRSPITIVELDLDYCQLTYGQSPCTAGIGVTGSTYCYNTRATCQDTANYSPLSTASPGDRAFKVYRFCTARSDMPVNLAAIPSVQSVSLAPTKIEVAGGLGQRASVSISIQDHTYHDRGIDKYWATRFGGPFSLQADEDGSALQAEADGDELLARAAGTSVAASGIDLPGTYWGRLRARNVHYVGRVCRVLTGYLDADGYDPANFITRTYLLDSIAGPDANGRVTIKAKDPLKLADDDRAVAPRPSTGALGGAIDADDTAATLSPAGIGDTEYPASGWLRIGREVVSFTRVADSLTITRAQFGTVSEEHDADENCQLCLRYSADSIPDILFDLLNNYAAVSDVYLPMSAWETEAALYLTRTYSTLITEPTGVAKLIKELTQSAAFSIWWDERQALVLVRALRAPDAADVIDEESNILADSMAVSDKPDMRLSQGWVYTSQIDPTEGLEQARNYRQLSVFADLEAESPDLFGEPRIKKIFSRWITSRSVADEVAEQAVTQFGTTPRQLSWSLDAKDSSYWTGDLLFVNTRLVQSESGQNFPLAVQIIEADEAEAGHTFRYTAQAFNFVAPPLVGQVITIADSENDLNLITLYTSIYGAPAASVQVTFVVETGVTIGQDAAPAAMTTGIWPTGAQVSLEISGRVQGRGGNGFTYVDISTYATATDGGDALFVEWPITVTNFGEIWSGGGGGSERSGIIRVYGGGGGGSGSVPGVGGQSFRLYYFPIRYYPWPSDNPADGGIASNGTSSSGGAGQTAGAEPGCSGGAPGLPGEAGNTGAPGNAGNAVVGNSLVTWAAVGDIRGAQIG